MFSQESVSRAASPVIPVVSFIIYEMMKQEVPPSGSEVHTFTVDEDDI